MRLSRPYVWRPRFPPVRIFRPLAFSGLMSNEISREMEGRRGDKIEIYESGRERERLSAYKRRCHFAYTYLSRPNANCDVLDGLDFAAEDPPEVPAEVPDSQHVVLALFNSPSFVRDVLVLLRVVSVGVVFGGIAGAKTSEESDREENVEETLSGTN